MKLTGQRDLAIETAIARFDCKQCLAFLECMVKTGDKSAISAILPCLHHLRDWRAVSAALNALRRYAPRGDIEVMTAVTRCIDHAHPGVREAVISALGSLAEPGAVVVIDMLLIFVKHNNPHVCEAAVMALGKLVDTGNTVAVQAVIMQMSQRSAWSMRSSAMVAVGQIAKRGEEVAISKMVACLTDRDEHVNSYAVKVLREIIKVGDITIVSAILQNPGVWQASNLVVDALKKITQDGDVALPPVVSAFIKQSKPDVRQAAVWAFGELAKEGNVVAIDAVVAHLHDKNWNVWSAVEAVLQEIAENDDRPVVKKVLLALRKHKEAQAGSIRCGCRAPQVQHNTSWKTHRKRLSWRNQPTW
jgi:HEAT repeat protein